MDKLKTNIIVLLQLVNNIKFNFLYSCLYFKSLISFKNLPIHYFFINKRFFYFSKKFNRYSLIPKTNLLWGN